MTHFCHNPMQVHSITSLHGLRASFFNYDIQCKKLRESILDRTTYCGRHVFKT